MLYKQFEEDFEIIRMVAAKGLSLLFESLVALGKLYLYFIPNKYYEWG